MSGSGYTKRIGECYYCGIELEYTGTADHILPRSKYKYEYNNKVLACPMCNNAKGNLKLEEFKETPYYKHNCLNKIWRGMVLRKKDPLI